MGSVNLQNLHNSLVQSAKRFHLAEADLLEHIQRAERSKLFLHRGFDSMFKYMTEEIGLSAASAYSFISVARKSREVPELKKAIEKGELGISKANRIVSVINSKNQSDWIEKAKTLSSRKLEDEVVESNPDIKPKGYTKRLSKEITRVALDLSPEVAALLTEAKDLLSSKNGSSINNEEAFEQALRELVEKYSPVAKAKRAKAAKEKKELQSKSSSVTKQGNSSEETTSLCTCRVKLPSENGSFRTRFTAEEKHAVQLKTGGSCTFVGENGQRCGCTRHLHIHHIKPVSEGGGNELSNLTLLCSRHHKLVHERDKYRMMYAGFKAM